MKPETRGALIGTVLIVATMWAASAIGTALTGVPDSPATSTGGSIEEGEAPVAPPVVDSSPSPAALVTPRAHTAKASRTRELGRPSSGTLHLSVTAYCPTGNLTASGKTPREGMAAGNDWPFGTRLLVEGVGVVTVEDRYGSGTDLDVFKDSCAAARDFGRRALAVEVIR